MNKKISTEISAAKSRIEDAEHALEAAIATSEGGTRADKMTINLAVGEALQQLKDAKSILDALEIADPVDKRR